VVEAAELVAGISTTDLLNNMRNQYRLLKGKKKSFVLMPVAKLAGRWNMKEVKLTQVWPPC